MVKTNLQRDPAVLPQVYRLSYLLFLPIPEVDLPTVLALGHILGIEAAPVGVRGGPLARDHDVVAGLVPEVVVVAHASRALLPATGYVEVLVEQEEASGAVALAVAYHRDHDCVRQTVHGVRGGEVCFLDNLLGLYHLVHLGCSLVLGINNVDTARAFTRNHKKAPRLALIIVAGAADVPAEVVQLVADVGHGGALDHPRVSGGLRIHVNGRQVVRLLNPRPNVERYGVEHLLALGLHRFLGRGVARSTTGVALVVRLVRVGHDAYSFLPLLRAGQPSGPNLWPAPMILLPQSFRIPMQARRTSENSPSETVLKVSVGPELSSHERT